MPTEISTRPEGAPEKIRVPASSSWPFVLAFGLTLVFAGMVTAPSLSILGVALALVGTVGWFRQVLPLESHELVTVVHRETAIETDAESVERLTNVREIPRAWLPLEIYPISAGVKGGLAGGVAMAVIAALYGIFSGNGVWYPMNLLVAGFFPSMASETTSQIQAFNLQQFIVAIPIHLLVSLLVGLLYGAMLPMASRRPILLGGFAGPLLWSFLIYGSLAAINPVMNQRIDWLWFVLSQILFGIVAGSVVARQERISTRQLVPLPARLGIETPGLIEVHHDDNNEGLR